MSAMLVIDAIASIKGISSGFQFAETKKHRFYCQHKSFTFIAYFSNSTDKTATVFGHNGDVVVYLVSEQHVLKFAGYISLMASKCAGPVPSGVQEGSFCMSVRRL